MAKTGEHPLLVTQRAACEMLSISYKLFKGLTDSGEIRIIRIGSRILVPVRELEAWTERQLNQ